MVIDEDGRDINRGLMTKKKSTLRKLAEAERELEYATEAYEEAIERKTAAEKNFEKLKAEYAAELKDKDNG